MDLVDAFFPPTTSESVIGFEPESLENPRKENSKLTRKSRVLLIASKVKSRRLAPMQARRGLGSFSEASNHGEL
jgi:hypothetical protein